MSNKKRFGQLELALFQDGVEIAPFWNWKHHIIDPASEVRVYLAPRLADEASEIVGRLCGDRGCKSMFYRTEVQVDGAFIPFGESHTSIKDALLTLQRGYGLINFWDLEDLG